VFTTRPDTIFGVDFMVVAPEHEIVKEITSKDCKEEVEKYLKYVESRSEIDRMAEVKKNHRMLHRSLRNQSVQQEKN